MQPMSAFRYAEFASISAVAVLALGSFSACKSKEATPERQTPPPSESQSAVTAVPAMPVRVEVTSDGFQPNRVNLEGGRQLVFRRTSESTCATAVVFPELGIEKQLPLNADVAIDLPASASGEIGFQCGMGMYKSKVVVR